MMIARPLVPVAAAALLSVGLLVGTPAHGVASARAIPAAAARCAATRVHYQPYRGVEAGLAPLPWIAASPQSSGIVGHLFYYDRRNVWKEQLAPQFHMYHSGQSPDGRVSMKILWALRRGSATAIRVQGKSLDHAGSFSEDWPAIPGNRQFPSIINVPTPGCWRLTLRAGNATAQVTVLAV